MQKTRVEYIKYLKLEESYGKQKAGYDWFESGDINTKFFYSIVKGRINRFKIAKILNDDGCWIEEEGQIKKKSIKFYKKQFTQERDATEFPLLNYIPRRILRMRMICLRKVPK